MAHMTEKDLIQQLKTLKQIKPKKDWVVLTKERIFSGEPEEGPKTSFVLSLPFFQYKMALAPIVSIFIIIGLFGFAQKTVPGDLLFSVKKITETVQIGFSSTIEKSSIQLKLTNKRLEELGKIAEANDVRNLGQAIEEFQASATEAAKNLAGIESSSDSALIKEILAETQKLEENKQKINALGVEIGETKELDNALGQLVQRELWYLAERTLSDAQQAFFTQAQEAFLAGDYSQALVRILDINQLIK